MGRQAGRQAGGQADTKRLVRAGKCRGQAQEARAPGLVDRRGWLLSLVLLSGRHMGSLGRGQLGMVPSGWRELWLPHGLQGTRVEVGRGDGAGDTVVESRQARGQVECACGSMWDMYVHVRLRLCLHVPACAHTCV